MFELWKRSGVDAAVGATQSRRSPALWIGVLLLAGGLDIFPVMRNYAVTGTLSGFPENWAEQVTPWIWTALWVPHHAAALVAAFVGFIALARPAEIDCAHAAGGARFRLHGWARRSMSAWGGGDGGRMAGRAAGAAPQGRRPQSRARGLGWR